MQAERMKVIAVIKDFTEGLRAEQAHPRQGPRDETAMRELLRLACERQGVEAEAYKAAIASDPTLAKMEQDAIVQALSGTSGS